MRDAEPHTATPSLLSTCCTRHPPPSHPSPPPPHALRAVRPSPPSPPPSMRHTCRLPPTPPTPPSRMPPRALCALDAPYAPFAALSALSTASSCPTRRLSPSPPSCPPPRSLSALSAALDAPYAPFAALSALSALSALTHLPPPSHAHARPRSRSRAAGVLSRTPRALCSRPFPLTATLLCPAATITRRPPSRAPVAAVVGPAVAVTPPGCRHMLSLALCAPSSAHCRPCSPADMPTAISCPVRPLSHPSPPS
ncbi:hypothetical protein DENSPDRAFT_885940 [Dentipellis sp. KUC8613]|nr:hypothetical protein DENSPDRAFT_885940 [Dentipellis sp. KUC8613]